MRRKLVGFIENDKVPSGGAKLVLEVFIARHLIEANDKMIDIFEGFPLGVAASKSFVKTRNSRARADPRTGRVADIPLRPVLTRHSAALSTRRARRPARPHLPQPRFHREASTRPASPR